MIEYKVQYWTDLECTVPANVGDLVAVITEDGKIGAVQPEESKRPTLVAENCIEGCVEDGRYLEAKPR